MATQHTIVLAVVAATLGCLAHAQQQQTTPVPILKQINRHNDDGSYSYGYEGADGSFKVETKHATGEVFGKYGYVDDTGKVREIEYGASKRGFEPAGTGIQVAPPTLNNDYNSQNQVGGDGYDDGQYREDPSIYYKEYTSNSRPKSVFNNQPHRFSNPPQHLQQQQQQYTQPQAQYNQPQQQRAYNPPQQQYNPPQQHYRPQQYNAPQQYNRPQYNPPQQQYNPPQQLYSQQRSYAPPAPIDTNLFRGHPATNFDVNSGSYTINYK